MGSAKGVIILVFAWVLAPAIAQQSTEVDRALPKVYLIGTIPSNPHSPLHGTDQSLLASHGHDMDAAFDQWLGLLKAMSTQADRIGFQLNGIKLWLNVHWDEEGRIHSLGYIPKPNSRNIDSTEIRCFLTSFIDSGQYGLATGSPYCHYGTVSFPYLPSRYGQQGKEAIGG